MRIRIPAVPVVVAALVLTGCDGSPAGPPEVPASPESPAYRDGAATLLAPAGLDLAFPDAPARSPDMARLVPSLADPIMNGSFETNGGVGTVALDYWDNLTSGNGSFLAQAGTASPLNGFEVPAPPHGSFAAMADMGGPGVRVLAQLFEVPMAPSMIHFELFLWNQAEVFFSPPSLWPFEGVDNQQFRADIITPETGPVDLGPGVLSTLYQTQPGDAAMSGYAHVSGDLTSLAGQTVRVRFVEVDNVFFFNVGIDNVFISLEPDIDIKPGSDPNSINTRSRGVIPVAVLGSDVFDVGSLDASSFQFGGASPAHDLTDPSTLADHQQDVNDDGYTDLVLHFPQALVGLTLGDVEACIIGYTTGGMLVHGCDAVNVLVKP